MPLTFLQKKSLTILAANRSEESHFAGGIVLHYPDDSPRYSHDFDIFHEVAAEVTNSSDRDAAALRGAGYQVETPSRYGEWEKEATFRKAKICRGNESVEIDWPPSAGPRVARILVSTQYHRSK